MAKLLLYSRSHADDVCNSLRIIYDEADAFLRTNGVPEADTTALAKACFADWDAYQWLSGSMDGRVRGTAGADDLRQRFSLLSAAMAAHCAGRAIYEISEQAALDDPKVFCAYLVSMNPGNRALPLGMNAASGLAYVVHFAQLAERAIINLRVSLRLGAHDDLQSATDMAARGARLAAAASIRQSKIAKNERSVDHARVVSRYDHLKAALDTRSLAPRIASDVGCTPTTVRRILDRDRPGWRDRYTKQKTQQ